MYKYYSLGRSETEECYPNGFQIKSDAYYSPGVCPSGWEQACGAVGIIGTVTETRATCCPRYEQQPWCYAYWFLNSS